MDHLLHRDNDDREAREHSSQSGQGDREITLGTTMILAIFFALAVFAAVFFGFGYSMGSKRNAAAAALPAVASSPASTAGAAAAKPNAGSLFNDPASSATENARAAQATRVSAPAAPNAPPTRKTEALRPPQQAASSSGPALPPALQPVVQIAAVSHQEDADLLVSTLKRRGYAVAVRNDQRDRLLHVQVGPFATRQEADAMRQRLVGDGFNAIVKEPGR